jgi:GT2 family glycosyltransferase
MGSPLPFSIVIPSCQRVDLLEICLASVGRHAPPGTQVIVVDDASERAVVSEATGRFAGVQVIRLDQRRGFCAAVNAGVAAASGAIVELLNDDTEVTAGWAEPALAWFADPAVGAVAPLVLVGPEGDRIDSAGDCYYVGGVAGKRCRNEPVSQAPRQPVRVFGACGSSAFYRRAALCKVGGFPETFGAYFDDVDVAFRLNRAGWQTMHEPASRVLHLVSASYGKASGALLASQSHNEERVFWRNLGGRELTRALPKHLAVLAAKAWRRWREGNLGPFLRGRLRLLGELPTIMRHRRQVALLGPDTSLENWAIDRRWRRQ